MLLSTALLLSATRKKMKSNLNIVYMVMLTLIMSACSSNPADDMETGIQYTYYPDGSCKDRDNNKCVTKNL